MWMRDLFSPALQSNDGFNAHWEIDNPPCATAWPDMRAQPACAGETPGTRRESACGRPLGLFHTPLGPSRPASGYDPEWCRA
jgi:hypothetical protein